MVGERFPQRKYLKQLRGMQDAFGGWAAEYSWQAHEAEDQRLRRQLRRRVELLEELRVDIELAFRRLEELPRLT